MKRSGIDGLLNFLLPPLQSSEIHFHDTCKTLAMLFDFQNRCYVIITSTTYGTWLPGNERGFAGYVRDENHNKIMHTHPNPQTMPALKQYASLQLKESPVFFTTEHAKIILTQWIKEQEKYQWSILAAAVMKTHFHAVVSAARDVEKDEFLRIFKSRASFALNKKFGSRTWWTASGSVQYCKDESSVLARINYVKQQDNPLQVWTIND